MSCQDTVFEEYLRTTRAEGQIAEHLLAVHSQWPDVTAAMLKLTPSLNTVRVFLQLADQVSRRDNVSLSSVFKDAQLDVLAEDTGCSRKERQKKLRQNLERLRYPERSALEARIKNCQREIFDSTGLWLEVPEDLEGDTLQLSITSRTPQGFKDAARRLEQLSKHKACEEVFSILRGEW